MGKVAVKERESLRPALLVWMSIRPNKQGDGRVNRLPCGVFIAQITGDDR